MTSPTRDAPLRGPRPVVALTVAGSDSGGGAGIQADLRTFAAHGLHGTSAVTALTAQDSRRVLGVLDVPADFVILQARAVLEDLPVSAIKTGMLGRTGIVLAVARLLQDARRGAFRACPAIVADPVLASGTGASLLEDEALPALREVLLPEVDVLTPNLPEAALLLGADPATAPRWSRPEREAAAESIRALGPRAVLLKGGHAEGATVAADVLATREGTAWLEAPWIGTPHVHGTGCTLASAIAAGLALGLDVPRACASAKRYLSRCLAEATPLGARGTPNQLHGLAPWDDRS